MQENERPAQGVRGYLIRTLDDNHPLVFRTYSEDRKSHKDYIIAHHDLGIMIWDNYSSFFEEDSGVGDPDQDYDGRVDYPSRKTLSKAAEGGIKEPDAALPKPTEKSHEQEGNRGT